MELLVILLVFALIIGLVIRNKGDNTMDTLSKGCGCMVTLFVILICSILYVMYDNGTI